MALLVFVWAASTDIDRYDGELPGFNLDWEPEPPEPETPEPQETVTCPPDPDPDDPTVPIECLEPEEEIEDREPMDLSWLDPVLRVLLILGAIGLIGALAYLITSWLRNRDTSRPEPVEIEDLEAAAKATEEAAIEQASATGTARNAVVACWVALEDAAEAAGLQRKGSETSEEFTQRVLSRWEVDSATIHELAELYRTARFSREELSADDRHRAVNALQRVHSAILAHKAAVDAERAAAAEERRRRT
ncbi:DUF4129 domain-containing protein [Nesterenkonia sedimenti]|uniref:DUF4129 domain-containing protein n=1 Tax=Nesterenkonia sedimenti TaxID=1463632 RepID=UPI0014567E4E|nr:DUF4129 domain-containing protein [Nesterenkonia sedimenti]